MEIEYQTAQKVDSKKMKQVTHYIPLYTMDGDFWMTGIMSFSEEEAINATKYYKGVTKIRIIKVDLPVLTLPEGIEFI